MNLGNPQRLTLAGYDDVKLEDAKCVSIYHGRQIRNIRPHHVFRNWIKSFRLPWICFCEIAIFGIYFFFANFHQSSAVAFTLDFNEAIGMFFLQDIDLPANPLGIPIGSGQIYFEDDLLNIINITAERFFLFSDSFPCAHPLIVSPTASMTINLQNGTSISANFSSESTQTATNMCNQYIQEFDSISLSIVYHIQVENRYHDNRMNVEVMVHFKHDYDSDTIFMDLYHTRFQEKFEISWSTILTTMDFSFPILIIVLNTAAILVSIDGTIDLYHYCYAKALDTGSIPFDVFWSKLDKWDIVAVITHLVSIGSSVMYLFIGQDIEDTVPPILYAMSAASLLHSILMIRYLKLKESTMLIIMVFYKSAIKIAQFLIGCFPIFLGSLCFANCCYGRFTEEFATWMQAAALLFCVMHGDSILGFYNALLLQFDMNYYFGFAYATFWIIFSLTIMFNITISIVQEMMTVEEYKLAHAADKNKEIPSFSILYHGFSYLSSKRPF